MPVDFHWHWIIGTFAFAMLTKLRQVQVDFLTWFTAMKETLIGIAISGIKTVDSSLYLIQAWIFFFHLHRIGTHLPYVDIHFLTLVFICLLLVFICLRFIYFWLVFKWFKFRLLFIWIHLKLFNEHQTVYKNQSS